jgi:hypothetical protein
MRKLLFFQSFTVLAVFTFAPLTSVAERVVIERPEGSEIKSIEIDDDLLIIKSKNKTHKFKLTELINSSSKKIETVNKEPANLQEAFEFNGELCIFQGQDAGSNSLKYLNKYSKKPFKTGDFFQRVSYKGKYYARDSKGSIYEPHWEVGKNFSPYLMPAKLYVKSIEKRIELLKNRIKDKSKQLDKSKGLLEDKREKYIAFLTDNNITTTMVDENGNIIRQRNSGDYDNKIKSALRRYYRSLRELEGNVKDSEKEFRRMKSQLSGLQDLMVKTQITISKYADNNSK